LPEKGICGLFAVKNHIGTNTVILSVLNGISSEAVIGSAYGDEKVLYCVTQGMDAVKLLKTIKTDYRNRRLFGGLFLLFTHNVA
jgi:2-dehydropantoate 2-reductase